MKTLVLTLFFYFSLFTAYDIYAGNSTMIANYPAPNGSYNNVVLNTQLTTNIDCSIASNAGLLFMNSTLNALEICVNGQTVPVPYPETCFNRFCSTGGSPACPAGNFSTGSNCPVGFTQATVNGQLLVDPFITSASFTVYSTLCCNSSTTVLPSS
jgi:hypothetical protein